MKSEIVTLILWDCEASAAVFVVCTWAAGLQTIGYCLWSEKELCTQKSTMLPRMLFKYAYTHTHVAKTFSVKEGVGSLILMFWCKFLTLMRTDTLSIWWTNTEGPSVLMNVYVVVRELVGGCYAEFTFQNNFCDYRIESGVGRGRRRASQDQWSREEMAVGLHQGGGNRRGGLVGWSLSYWRQTQ